jgi:hypothetical protein
VPEGPSGHRAKGMPTTGFGRGSYWAPAAPTGRRCRRYAWGGPHLLPVAKRDYKLISTGARTGQQVKWVEAGSVRRGRECYRRQGR